MSAPTQLHLGHSTEGGGIVRAWCGRRVPLVRVSRTTEDPNICQRCVEAEVRHQAAQARRDQERGINPL